jgi:hypothetical protein
MANILEFRAAVLLKNEGWTVLRRGWPDFLCFRNVEGRTEILCVEVKSRNGRLSAEQMKAHELLRTANLPIRIMRPEGEAELERGVSPRGVYEKVRGSGIWYIHYYDADGRRHREKVGRFELAMMALSKKRASKHKNLTLDGEKLGAEVRALRKLVRKMAEVESRELRAELIGMMDSRGGIVRALDFLEELETIPGNSIETYFPRAAD